MATKRPRAGTIAYTITDIKYDIDGGKPRLPKTLRIEVPTDIEGYDDIEQYISDEISNITGYCHEGFATTPEIPED